MMPKVLIMKNMEVENFIISNYMKPIQERGNKFIIMEKVTMTGEWREHFFDNRESAEYYYNKQYLLYTRFYNFAKIKKEIKTIFR